MSKHTPGPWGYRTRRHDDWGCVRGPDGCVVAWARPHPDADLSGFRGNRVDPAEANARLIAAAPELLGALEQAEAYIASLDQNLRQPAIGLRLSLIRVAIAKAKGEVAT